MSDPAAIALGLGAALVLGIAEVADQRSTKRVRHRRALSPRILVDLVRQPLWLASIAGTVLGFGLQVLALRFGPLALVEPLLLCDLIFAVLLSGLLRRVLDPIVVGGVVATAGGVATFLAVARPTAGHSSVGFFVVLPLAAGLAAAVAACLLASRHSNDNVRALALALACGICFGFAAFLIKLVVSPTGAGLAGILTDWPIYALVIVGPLGFLLNLNAFQQGAVLPPVLTIITVCDPLISIALARLWLDEKLSSSPAAIAAEIIALAVMVAGIVVVTDRSPHLVEAAKAKAAQAKAAQAKETNAAKGKPG